MNEQMNLFGDTREITPEIPPYVDPNDSKRRGRGKLLQTSPKEPIKTSDKVILIDREPPHEKNHLIGKLGSANDHSFD